MKDHLAALERMRDEVKDPKEPKALCLRLRGLGWIILTGVDRFDRELEDVRSPYSAITALRPQPAAVASAPGPSCMFRVEQTSPSLDLCRGVGQQLDM